MAEENMVSNLETNHTFMKCKTYKDHAMLKLAYIDLKDYLSTLQQKHDSLIEQLAEVDAVLEENPNSKKNKTSAQIQQQVDSNERKLNETKNKIAEEGETLNLAALLYNEHEVYYLSSGSNPKYNAYMGAYRLQWDMIKFAKSTM